MDPGDAAPVLAEADRRGWADRVPVLLAVNKTDDRRARGRVLDLQLDAQCVRAARVGEVAGSRRHQAEVACGPLLLLRQPSKADRKQPQHLLAVLADAGLDVPEPHGADDVPCAIAGNQRQAFGRTIGNTAPDLNSTVEWTETGRVVPGSVERAGSDLSFRVADLHPLQPPGIKQLFGDLPRLIV